jgi:hypothetical protein
MGTASIIVLLLLVSAVCFAQSLRLGQLRSQVRSLEGRHAFLRGLNKGQAGALDALRYEQEILDLQQLGFFHRRKSLFIRERVFLGPIRIAESDRTIVVSCELTLGNVWSVVDAVAQLYALPSSRAVVRTIRPAVAAVLSKNRGEAAAA